MRNSNTDLCCSWQRLNEVEHRWASENQTPTPSPVGGSAGERDGCSRNAKAPRESSGREYRAVAGEVVEDASGAPNDGGQRVLVDAYR